MAESDGEASGLELPAGEILLAFWFGREPLLGKRLGERMRTWFSVDPAFDAELRARFAPLVRKARVGELDAWAASPRGRLALILLLDQLPRNLYRGEPSAFATDAQALAWALTGIAAGLDRALPPIERTFFYMPMQHVEDLDVQERGVALFQALAREAPRELRPALEDSAAYAALHRDLIARFGRFPHRNRLLARTATADEEKFLAEGGARFGQ